MPVVVRRATKDDASIIAKFAMALVEQHIGYDPVRFARIATEEGMAWFYGGQIEAGDTAVLAAEVDGLLAGFAYVTFETKNYAELSVFTARLQDIYVDERFLSGGAGRALVDAAKSEAKRFGAKKLILSVAAQNAAARGFFEKFGFRTTMFEMMAELTAES